MINPQNVGKKYLELVNLKNSFSLESTILDFCLYLIFFFDVLAWAKLNFYDYHDLEGWVYRIMNKAVT